MQLLDLKIQLQNETSKIPSIFPVMWYQHDALELESHNSLKKYSVCYRNKLASKIHAQSTKVWHSVYNSHVPILQRQSRYELHFQKLGDFTTKSWESKQQNPWDNNLQIVRPLLHQNEIVANFSQQWDHL